MNNFLTELLNRNTDNLQIHYYENINIYTNSNSRNDRLNDSNTNNLSTRIPVPPRVVNTNINRNLRQRNFNRNNHRTRNNSGNDRINNQNETTHVETVEMEPIVTSITLNPVDTNINQVFTQLTNSLLNNFSQNGSQSQPVTLENLNNKTSLKTVEENENYEVCNICRSEISENQIIRKINDCNHYFHQECVDRWFASNSTCPVCRINLNETENNETE